MASDPMAWSLSSWRSAKASCFRSSSFSLTATGLQSSQYPKAVCSTVILVSSSFVGKGMAVGRCGLETLDHLHPVRRSAVENVAWCGQECAMRVVVSSAHGVANAGELTHGSGVSVGEVESCVWAAEGESLCGCEGYT